MLANLDNFNTLIINNDYININMNRVLINILYLIYFIMELEISYVLMA